jgi:hypothetical protein
MHEIPLTPLRNDLTDGLFAHRHLEKIEDLREVHHHSIRSFYVQIRAFNCFAYAFGLTDDDTHNRCDETKVYPDARFVHWMRALRRLTEIENPDGRSCVALYFLMDGVTNRCRHAAIRRPDGRMISKWGSYSIYEHDLAEVPSNYGDHVLYIAKPSENEIRELFSTYIQRCQGLPSWAFPFGS